MSVTEQLRYITIEKYLDDEQHSDIRHEYVAGAIYAMVGANALHNLIAGSLFSSFRSHLEKSPCYVFQSDMKVRVDDAFYYPDVFVTCEKLDPLAYYQTAPSLIVEVLSESTEARDRLEKWLAYQKLESLREYALVAQDKIKVEVLRHTEDGWQKETYSAGDRVKFDSIGLTIPIESIYMDAIDYFR